jgi:hypothetical protein
MYPLLISAATTLGSKLIDSFQQAAERKQAVAGERFDRLMSHLETQAAGATSGVAPAPGAAVNPQVNRLKQLQQQILDSPELKAAIQSTDPTKPLNLQVSPEGKVTIQSGESPARTVSLGPETAQKARELGALLGGGLPCASLQQSAQAATALAAHSSTPVTLHY